MRKCLFSGEDAEFLPLQGCDGLSVKTEKFGKYFISGFCVTSFSGNNPLSEKEKLLCLQETIKLNRDELIPFWTLDAEHGPSVDRFQNAVWRSVERVRNREINHQFKDDRILTLLAQKISGKISPFSYTTVSLADQYFMGLFDNREIWNWLKYLRKENFVQFDTHGESFISGNGDHHIQRFINHVIDEDSVGLTVEGWNYVHQKNIGKSSKNVFVAMAFTDEKKNPVTKDLSEAIKGTLVGLGWNPVIVNEVEHNDGIMDKVIASINSSRFVVAELTHQKSGVYYEAGYAKGIGLPVIHVVHKDDLANSHFDVKHLNLIVWEDLNQLQEKLRNRIHATVLTIRPN